MNSNRFTGKVVVITGAASGIGEGAARRFAAEGAHLVLGDKDAAGLKRLAAELGDAVEISSPHGRTEAIAMVVDSVRRGEVFTPFHYGRNDQSANVHTWFARDAVSKQPHFKSSPVSLRRLSFGEPEPWLLARRDELTGKSVTPFAAQTLGDTVSVKPAAAPATAS